MAKLNKQQLGLIKTALKNRAPQIKVTKAWQHLAHEFNLGEIRGNYLYFSASDYQTLKNIAIADSGYDPISTTPSGNRTEVAEFTVNEKFSRTSIIKQQVSCTAIGGPLVVADQYSEIITGVDYRIDTSRLKIHRYEAVMVVENYEAFIFIHQFDLPNLGHVLVLYRGHDSAAGNANNLIAQTSVKPIIGFTDPDPAGIGILYDNSNFTHALIPNINQLTRAPKKETTFAKQLAKRPLLKQLCNLRSAEFQNYVGWIIDNGFASSQEWLCQHKIPIQLVEL